MFITYYKEKNLFLQTDREQIYQCRKVPWGPFIVIKGTVFYIAENSKNQIRIKGKNIIIIIILLSLLLLKNMKFPANQSLIRTSFKKIFPRGNNKRLIITHALSGL